MTGAPVAVVTGGAGGIGAALARKFADAGYRVAVLDVDAEGAATVAERVAAECAPCPEVRSWVCDVTDADACSGVIADVVGTWGRIDVVLANAGLSHHSDFADTRLDVFRRVVEVNFFGAVHTVHAALPYVRERSGVIVATSSVAGFAPLLRRTAYAASKHALHGWLDSLREELRDDDVAVVLLCPSFVDTGIDRRALAGDGSTGYGRKPVSGRLLSADEVASAALRAVRRRRPHRVFVSGLARVAWWVSRATPRGYAAAMRRSQKVDSMSDASEA